jgi:predicted ATP-grasp superfamily ATP-dependent carboligase
MKGFNSDKPPAIVLGMGQNGLATVRALGRMGVPVISIGRNLKQFTARSRYCRKIRCPDFGSGEGLIDLLVEIGRQLPRKGVLFPSGDFSLHLISEKRELLKDYYHFTFPGRDIVNLTLDKKFFYKFAQERGFPIPQTFFPKGIDECRQVAKEINYPCIIKPYQPNLGWRQQFPDQKLFEAEEPKALLQLYERLVNVHHDLVVQECIPGDESNLSFSLTYFDSKSRPLGMFTGHKVRQYPPYFGTSSMAESRRDPRIADKTVEILQAMEYTGYGSVEFKWDPRDEQFKIIEISVRTWFPHGISAACGLNLEYMAYCDRVGLPKVPSNGFREGVKWIHEERDLKSSLYYLRKGEMSFLQWLKSYRGKRTYALSSWDDPIPFIYFLGHLIMVPWRRMLRHVSS